MSASLGGRVGADAVRELEDAGLGRGLLDGPAGPVVGRQREAAGGERGGGRQQGRGQQAAGEGQQAAARHRQVGTGRLRAGHCGSPGRVDGCGATGGGPAVRPRPPPCAQGEVRPSW